MPVEIVASSERAALTPLDQAAQNGDLPGLFSDLDAAAERGALDGPAASDEEAGAGGPKRYTAEQEAFYEATHCCHPPGPELRYQPELQAQRTKRRSQTEKAAAAFGKVLLLVGFYVCWSWLVSA